MEGIRIFMLDGKGTTGKTIYEETYDYLNFNNCNLKQKARLPILIRNIRKHFV